MRAAWLLLALLHLVPGVGALLFPSWFAAEVAGIATSEPHFVRDVGVAELTLGAAALVALARPAAARPLAAVMAVHLVLHAGSHVVDEALNAAVTATFVAQAALLILAARRSRAARPAAMSS